MKNPVVMIILTLVLLMPFVSSLDRQSCESIFYFIIQNINSQGQLTYKSLDLQNFFNKNNISNISIIDYYRNYDKYCKNYTNLSIPKNNNNFIYPNYNFNTSCDLNINSTLLGIDLDKSFPSEIEGLNIGNVSCESMEKYKYLLKYDKLDDINYGIKGVKIWLFYAFLLLIGFLIFINIIRVYFKEANSFKHIYKDLKNSNRYK